MHENCTFATERMFYVDKKTVKHESETKVQ